MPANGSQARPLPATKPDRRARPPASSTAATNALEASRSRGDPLRSGMNSPTPHTIRTCAEALSIQPWRVTRSHSSSPGAVPTIAGTWTSVATMVSSRTSRPAKRAPAWRPRDRPTTPAAQSMRAAPVATGPVAEQRQARRAVQRHRAQRHPQAGRGGGSRQEPRPGHRRPERSLSPHVSAAPSTRRARLDREFPAINGSALSAAFAEWSSSPAEPARRPC